MRGTCPFVRGQSKTKQPTPPKKEYTVREECGGPRKSSHERIIRHLAGTRKGRGGGSKRKIRPQEKTDRGKGHRTIHGGNLGSSKWSFVELQAGGQSPEALLINGATKFVVTHAVQKETKLGGGKELRDRKIKRRMETKSEKNGARQWFKQRQALETKETPPAGSGGRRSEIGCAARKKAQFKGKPTHKKSH